jgi:lipopolysaccharide export system permease protein
MRILSKYLMRLHVAPFLFALAALTGFMLLNQIARRLEQLVGKGLPWTILVEFFLLTIPYLIAMTISMSVLVAVLHTFSRLAHDNEITAMRASGISLGQLVRPVLLAGTIVAVIAFLFGDQVLPRTNHRLRALMNDIGRTKPTFNLKEHTINEVQAGRVFLRTAHIDQSSYRMHDVTIYRLTDQRTTQIVYADSGQIAFDSTHTDLHVRLYEGTAHEIDRRNPGMFERTEYDTYLIKLENIGREFERRDNDTYLSDRERGVCSLEEVVRTERRKEELHARRAEVAERNGLRILVGLPPVQPDTAVPLPRRSVYCAALSALLPEKLEAQSSQDSVTELQRARLSAPARRSYVTGGTPRSRLNESRLQNDRSHSSKVQAAVFAVELHKKYSIPAACIVFVILGIPVGIRFRHGGLGMVLGIGMVIFTIYYIGLISGESLANRLTVPPFWAMWTPNVAFGLLGLVLLWRAGREGKGRSGTPGPIPDPAAAQLPRS